MKSSAIIKRTASVHGFTLVEILVVIAITASPAPDRHRGLSVRGPIPNQPVNSM
jgi:prepilin-type N-terminal cleavage/methylation domain-containing protein